MCFVCKGQSFWEVPAHYLGRVDLTCDSLRLLPPNSIRMCGDLRILNCPLLTEIGEQPCVGSVKGVRSRLHIENLPRLTKLGGFRKVLAVRLYNLPLLASVPAFFQATCVRLGDLASVKTVAVQPCASHVQVRRCGLVERLLRQPRLRFLSVDSCKRLTRIDQPTVCFYWHRSFLHTEKNALWCTIRVHDCRLLTSAPWKPMEVGVYSQRSLAEWQGLQSKMPFDAWRRSIPWLRPGPNRLCQLIVLQRWFKRRALVRRIETLVSQFNRGFRYRRPPTIIH